MRSTAEAPLGTRVGRLVAVLGVVLTATFPAGIGVGGAEAALGASHRQGQAAGGELRVESQSAFVDVDSAFDLLISTGPTPPGATMSVTVHDAVSRGRFRFEENIAGESLGRTLLRHTGIDVDTARAFGGGRVGIRIPVADRAPAPDGGVVLPRTGVHPVVVRMFDADGTELDQLVTFLIRVPTPEEAEEDEQVPIGFALVIPLTGPVAFRPDRTVALEPLALARWAEVATAVGTRPGLPLTLAPTPETLDALEETETAGPTLEVLRAALDRRQVLAAPYVPLDLEAWEVAGLGESVADQVSRGIEVAAGVLGARPSGRTWLTDATVGPSALARLADLGVDRFVVAEERLDPLDARRFPVTLTQPFEIADASGRTHPAMAADTALAEHLRRTDDPVLAAHLVLADLAILQLDRPTLRRGAVLALPDDAAPGAFLDALLGGLAQTPAVPMVVPRTVDELFATSQPATQGGEDDPGSPPLVRSTRTAPPGDLGTYPIERADTVRGLDGFRAMLDPDSPRFAPLDRLLAVSGDRRLPPVDRSEYLLTIQGVIGDDLARITTPPRQSVTLTAEESTLPMVIENGLGEPAAVQLVLHSEKLDFPDGNVVDAALRPGTNRIEIRVRARASGTFPLDVAVRSPDETLDITSTRFSVRSAAISGLGLVLSVGAGLFLAIWWARHWRSARRSRGLVAGPGAGPDPPPWPPTR